MSHDMNRYKSNQLKEVRNPEYLMKGYIEYAMEIRKLDENKYSSPNWK
jgi:hypothetical protein